MTPPVTPKAAAILAALAATATILGALVFEHGFGLKPCPLCLTQRIPYYAGIPVAVLAALLAGAAPRLSRLVLALFALAMLIGAGIAVYHSGVEWKWWAGPSDCSGGADFLNQSGSVLDSLNETTVIRCDEAAWRFLGLSLAGWNVLISLALAALAARGAYGSSSTSQ